MHRFHEAWNLGDYVRVEDKDLGLSVTTRIVRREYNLQEPWNTVLELSTTLKNLGSPVSYKSINLVSMLPSSYSMTTSMPTWASSESFFNSSEAICADSVYHGMGRSSLRDEVGA